MNGDAAAKAPSDRTTLVEVLGRYEAAGFGGQMAATPEGLILCYTCGHETDPRRATLQSLRRLEGASDPDDMLAVMAIECPHCSIKGVLIANYGPEAEPGESAIFLALRDRRFDDGPLPAANAPEPDDQS